MELRAFTVNPFQENTYLVWDAATRLAALVDPGMAHPDEEQAIADVLNAQGLTLRHVWLTHAHIDHVLGCGWAYARYGLAPWLHPDDLPLYRAVPQQAQMFGVPCGPLPEPAGHFDASKPLALGETTLELRHCPGHAPGHLVFIDHAAAQVLVGDVVFEGSIGRTDLPGGDYPTLLRSIHTQLLTLPDGYALYPGHMGATTVGRERRSNPFLQG